MPFLPPNQQCQSTEGIYYIVFKFVTVICKFVLLLSVNHVGIMTFSIDNSVNNDILWSDVRLVMLFWALARTYSLQKILFSSLQGFHFGDTAERGTAVATEVLGDSFNF